MDSKILYIFVEGGSDKRFFENILAPRLQKKHVYIKIIMYTHKHKFKYIKKYIKSLQSMRIDYIYIEDIDNSPCVTAKKQETKNKINNIDTNKIIVVIKEIESWYLAGLDRNSAKKLGIKKVYDTTDTVIKEQFDSLIPKKKFDSRIDFMMEILKNFSLEIAQQKNKSLKYCIRKLINSSANNI